MKAKSKKIEKINKLMESFAIRDLEMVKKFTESKIKNSHKIFKENANKKLNF